MMSWLWNHGFTWTATVLGTLLGFVGLLANLATLDHWNRSRHDEGEIRDASTITCQGEPLLKGEVRTLVGDADEVQNVAVPPPPLSIGLDELRQLVRESGREGAQEVAAVVLSELQQLKADLANHKREVLPRLGEVESALASIRAQLKKQELPEPDPKRLEALVKKVVFEALEQEKSRTKEPPPPGRPASKLFKTPPPPARVNTSDRPPESARMLRVRAQAPCGCTVEMILPASGAELELRCPQTGRPFRARIESSAPLVVATRLSN